MQSQSSIFGVMIHAFSLVQSYNKCLCLMQREWCNFKTPNINLVCAIYFQQQRKII